MISENGHFSTHYIYSTILNPTVWQHGLIDYAGQSTMLTGSKKLKGRLSSLAFVVEIIRHHHTNKNSDRVVALTNINTNNAATDIMWLHKLYYLIFCICVVCKYHHLHKSVIGETGAGKDRD